VWDESGEKRAALQELWQQAGRAASALADLGSPPRPRLIKESNRMIS